MTSFKILTALLILADFGFGQSRLDGAWWNKANEDQRMAVVDGLFDCLVWEQGKEIPDLRASEFNEKINNFYQRNSQETPIKQVLLSIPKELAQQSAGGEDYSNEKHGYFDGTYWIQSNFEQQKGFILGYLTCVDDNVPRKDLVTRRVQQISKWYKTHYTQKQLNKKIPEVLQIVSTHIPPK
jgi:hypothetical protein